MALGCEAAYGSPVAAIVAAVEDGKGRGIRESMHMHVAYGAWRSIVSASAVGGESHGARQQTIGQI